MILGSLDDESVRAALWAALDHPHDDAFRCAAALLPLVGLGAHDGACVARLFDRAVPLARREALAHAVAGDAPAHVVPLIVPRLESVDVDERRIAAIALGTPRAAVALPELSALLLDEDEDEGVREAAAASVGALDGDDAIAVLCAAAGSLATRVRAAAVAALGARAFARGDAREALLRAALDDADDDVRAAALCGLVHAPDARARAAALCCLDEGAPALRAIAVILLGRCGHDDDQPRLQGLCNDVDPRVARGARTAVDGRLHDRHSVA